MAVYVVLWCRQVVNHWAVGVVVKVYNQRMPGKEVLLVFFFEMMQYCVWKCHVTGHVTIVYTP